MHHKLFCIEIIMKRIDKLKNYMVHMRNIYSMISHQVSGSYHHTINVVLEYYEDLKAAKKKIFKHITLFQANEEDYTANFQTNLYHTSNKMSLSINAQCYCCMMLTEYVKIFIDRQWVLDLKSEFEALSMSEAMANTDASKTVLLKQFNHLLKELEQTAVLIQTGDLTCQQNIEKTC